MRRRDFLAVSGAAALGVADGAAGAETVNPLAASISPGGETIKVVRVTAAAGGTRIADVDLPADQSPYPLFKQFLTHKADATAIYRAPPHHKIASRSNPAKEMLLIVSGETELAAAGHKRSCPPGTFIMLDAGGAVALSEKAGPNGYVAVKVVLAD